MGLVIDQTRFRPEKDKFIFSFLILLVGFSLAHSQIMTSDSTNGWGYGYDSLLSDIAKWKKSPYVTIDSIGASAQGRAIWMISITGSQDSLSGHGSASSRKHRVFIHARTHPAEVQANYIANEAIRFLTDETASASATRSGFIFNIIPMYNPDGVEKGHSRLNGNLVDLESNWNSLTLEPEVLSLKKTFQRFMNGPIPIEVALNLHSDQFNCTRFFFFHFAAGTSEIYTQLEKTFIEKVQSHFLEGIKNWDFVKSWDTGTKLVYPESFWWLTYQEKVLALTYEDTNCPNAGLFDSTAHALVLGSVDYIRERLLVPLRPWVSMPVKITLERDGIHLLKRSFGGNLHWEFEDIKGRLMASGTLSEQTRILDWSNLKSSTPGILSITDGMGLLGRFRLSGRNR